MGVSSILPCHIFEFFSRGLALTCKIWLKLFGKNIYFQNHLFLINMMTLRKEFGRFHRKLLIGEDVSIHRSLAAANEKVPLEGHHNVSYYFYLELINNNISRKPTLFDY